MSPLNQLFALITLVVCWNSGKRARLYFGLVFLSAVLVEVMTYALVFPLKAILFLGTEANADVLTKVWSDWRRFNWMRNLMLAFGHVCSMKGLDALYKATPIGSALRAALRRRCSRYS